MRKIVLASFLLAVVLVVADAAPQYNIFNRNDRQSMWQSLRRTSSQFFRDLRDLRRRFVNNIRSYSFLPARLGTSQSSSASTSPQSPNLNNFISVRDEDGDERRRRRQFNSPARPAPQGMHSNDLHESQPARGHRVTGLKKQHRATSNSADFDIEPSLAQVASEVDNDLLARRKRSPAA